MKTATIDSLVEVTAKEKLAFVENYEKTPFVFHHRLAGHELFQRSKLLQLVKKLANDPQYLYYNVGDPAIGSGWDFNPGRPFSAEEAFERIETANAWMILKAVHLLPEYKGVLDAFMREAYSLTGRDLDRETFNHRFAIIINSPNRVTPYHIDGESNYLLQLSGTKLLYVFDGSNPAVLGQEELETFWSGNLNAAVYKQDQQERSYQFELTPGDGVYVPTTFPHWVKNGASVSTSLSLTFQLRDRRVPELHRLNYALRKRGLKPQSPGQSRFSDSAKLAALRMIGRIR
jgi:hypothetical protein